MVFEMKTQGANKDRKQAEQPKVFPDLVMPAVLPDSNGGFMPCTELLTEEELVIFLRIPHVSNSKNYHNVIENLKRMHGLPRAASTKAMAAISVANLLQQPSECHGLEE
jgi:hypothetical protein